MRISDWSSDVCSSDLEQARAHDDLPFVWWVVDRVMEHDPRAWWMRHWVVGTRCIQTAQVFEQREPILYVGHDDDGWWQLIGSSDAGPDGKIGHTIGRASCRERVCPDVKISVVD